MPKAYTPPRSALDTFIPDNSPEPEPLVIAEPPPVPSDLRRVHSYKIRESIGRRLRKFAHNQDRAIAEVAEEAFLLYLDQQEAAP